MSKTQSRDRNADPGDLPELYHLFQGEVVSVQKYGVFISIPGYKRHGLVHVSQMSTARIEDPAEMLAKGENVFCKVISIETEGSKIGLSMKVVNQTTGADMDPNNVQLSQDAKKRKQFFGGQRPPIELGAVYDTKCRNCGGHGHLALECFVGKGQKQYDLVPELEDMVPSESDPETAPLQIAKTDKKKKKKEKKHKKDKKRKRKASTAESSDSGDVARQREAKKKSKRRKHSNEGEDSNVDDHRQREDKKTHKNRY